MSASNQASSASGATPRRAQKGRWIKLVVVGILLAGVLAHLWDASGVGSSGARVPDGHRAVVEKSMLTLPSARERSRGAGASARPRERVLARAQSIGALRDSLGDAADKLGNAARALDDATTSHLHQLDRLAGAGATLAAAKRRASETPESTGERASPTHPSPPPATPPPATTPPTTPPTAPPSPGRPSTVEVEARAVFDGDASARPATRDPDPSESDPSSLSWESSAIARNLARDFASRCVVVDGLFREVGSRYARANETGVIVMDWSENYFNGIGDEMQHYQEMLAIAIGTGRAPFLQTQKAECVGTGLAGSRRPRSVEHLATECRFDMGDYFAGVHGVDWKWDDAKEEAVRALLGRDERELVVTWSKRGMYYGESFRPGEEESPDGTYVSPPDADFFEVMMNDPRVRAAKMVRVRVRQNFGHWCHPTQRGDWGMCESYKHAAGIEREGVDPRDAPCPGCAFGGCFGQAVLQPRESLRAKIAPYLHRMEEKKWRVIVAAHVRVGFADVSQLPPPDVPREEEPTLANVDAFLASEAKRVPYPDPKCPAEDFGGADLLVDWPKPGDGPLSVFFDCVAKTAAALNDGTRGGEGRGAAPAKRGTHDPNAWGVFLTTDSPGMRSVIESSFPTLSDKIVVTDGAYGNVKFSNTGVCVEHSGDECDASDPRPAWERSMVDMYLVGVSDVVMMLYQSKFGQAASLRADVRHGRRELYSNTRITHSLVDPLVARLQGSPAGFQGAVEEDRRTWVRLWDLFGPPGDREGLRTSKYAKGG